METPLCWPIIWPIFWDTTLVKYALVDVANELHQTIEIDLQVESLTRTSPRAIILRRWAIIRTSHNGDLVNEKSLYPSYRPVNPDGTFQVNTDAFKQNVLGLTRNIMTMQATGDYAAAKGMAEKLGVIRPPVQAMLDKLKDAPVDIEPRYVTAQQRGVDQLGDR